MLTCARRATPRRAVTEVEKVACMVASKFPQKENEFVLCCWQRHQSYNLTIWEWFS
jgi:hypothetical protein